MMEISMECKNCEQIQRKFYCEQCLRTHIRKYTTDINHVAIERDEYVSRARTKLSLVEGGRGLRADVAGLQVRIEEAKRSLVALREQNKKTQERLAELRSSQSSRRSTLAQARLTLTAFGNKRNEVNGTYLAGKPSRAHDTQQPTLPRHMDAQAVLQDALARARSGLVQELVEVFSIVEVGGRPPLGGKAGTKGEWTIGGLVLPVPGDIRRYPPAQINAVITHTIHFLGLLTYYLGVKLPFEIVWSGNKLGVGTPSIYAGKGAEFGGWAKWTSENPLHLPLNPAAPSKASPTASPMNTSKSEPPSMAVEALMEVTQSYAELPLSSQPPATFSTAFAMLIYNVVYLAYTQSVEVPLSQAGEVLRNLWAVCCSTELGRRSHQTQPLLPAPTPPSFPLEFAQLLQAVTTNPKRSGRARSGSAVSGVTGRTSKKQPIIIEEDEWDFVEDAVEGPFA